MTGAVIVRYLAAAAIGYVLGSRAGRARYEQIRRGYRKVADHPAVQGAAGVARAKVEEKVPFVHKAATHTSPQHSATPEQAPQQDRATP